MGVDFDINPAGVVNEEIMEVGDHLLLGHFLVGS